MFVLKQTRYTILTGSRYLSQSREVGPKIKFDPEKKDPTEYRIPLLHEDQDQLFYSTTSDQWKLGNRPLAPNYPELAFKYGAKYKMNPQPIEHINKSRLTTKEREGLRKFSEFLQYEPISNIRDIHMRRDRSLTSLRSAMSLQGKSNSIYDALSGSGWYHTTNCGKSFGPPRKLNADGSAAVEYDTNFNSKVLQLDYRKSMFSKGEQAGWRVTVAVGNGNGLVGAGITFGTNLPDTLKEAKQYAYMQLVNLPMTETKSIPYSVRGRFHRTELHAVPGVPYKQNKAHRIVKELLDLAGYTNVGVKVFGRNPPESIVKAFFVAFTSFESHQEQADRLGRYVVEFKPTTYFTPKVLAVPKDDSSPVPYSAEIHESSQKLS